MWKKLPDHLRPSKNSKLNTVKRGRKNKIDVVKSEWRDQSQQIKPVIALTGYSKTFREDDSTYKPLTVGTLKLWLQESKEANNKDMTTVITPYGTYEISQLQQLDKWNDDSCTIKELVGELHD